MRLPPQSKTAMATTCLFCSAQAVQASARARAPALEMTLISLVALTSFVACIAKGPATTETVTNAESGSRRGRMRMVCLLCPTEAALAERQLPHPPACGREDRVGYCRQHGRQRRFTEPGRRVVGLVPVNLNCGGGLRHPKHLMLMEIGLLHAPRFEGDFLGHQLAQAVDDCPLHHVLGGGWIDDVAPHIAGYPNLVDLHAVLIVHAHIRDLGEVPEVAEVKRHAEGPPFG